MSGSLFFETQCIYNACIRKNYNVFISDKQDAKYIYTTLNYISITLAIFCYKQY